MAITATGLSQLIAQELETLADERVQAHIRTLFVAPHPMLRDWDYGQPGEQYPCWTVLNHDQSNTSIAYCEKGFGPKNPWGLVRLSGHEGMSMGMDSAWFRTFLDAYFDSLAATDLPIWRVFKTSTGAGRIPISAELEWGSAWKQIDDLRHNDPESNYDCNHSIKYGRMSET